MTINDIKAKLEKNLTAKRFAHSVNVMNSAVKLAERYGGDRSQAALAGILHDCARDIRGEAVFSMCGRYGIQPDEIMRAQPELIHGRLGAKLAGEEYGVDNPGVLKAIEIHTLGAPEMGLLDKIIFVADYIEPARSFTGVDAIRKAALTDLDKAVLLGLDTTISYIMGKGGVLHPDSLNTRNWLILNKHNVK